MSADPLPTTARLELWDRLWDRLLPWMMKRILEPGVESSSMSLSAIWPTFTTRTVMREPQRRMGRRGHGDSRSSVRRNLHP